MGSLEQVLREHWPEYSRLYAKSLTAEQRAAVQAILRCHSPECGGGLYHCEHCKKSHFVPHGCGNRACPQCGHHHAQRWVEAHSRRLLPVAYFMVTFTVPEALRRLFKAQPKVMMEALFAQSAGALNDVAAQPKHLGGKLGMIGVLHTWTRQLLYHPHVHYVVPGLAWSPQGELQTPRRDAYLLPVAVLKSRYRSRMRDVLSQKHPQLAAQLPKSVWRKAWNVNITAVGKGRGALGYLGRYVFKTALSATRIVRYQGGQVTFTYKDSQTGARRLCQLPALKFIGRFLQHVLPRGLHRVRHFGWLSPAAKKSFEKICASLKCLKACEPAAPSQEISVPCPQCQKPMRLLRLMPRAPPLP